MSGASDRRWETRGSPSNLSLHLPTQGQGESKSRNRGTSGRCLLVDLDYALPEAEKGTKNLGQRNKERPSARPIAPPPSWPSWSLGAGLGSSEQTGRELQAVWCPGPMVLCECGASSAPFPPPHALSPPLPPPTAAPELIPTQCHPALSPIGIPSLWLSMNSGGGKGTGKALDPVPSPHPRTFLGPEEKVCPKGWKRVYEASPWG